jgi:GDP-4-dehydro-6-deoxy-D-mannose reductase
MRYLITGSNGFIGEYLAEELLRQGHHVLACVQSSTPILEQLANTRNLELFYPDITVEKQIRKVIFDTQPDSIFHLAAQSLPRVSWEKPVFTMQVNLIGSLYILEAVRNLKTPPTLVVIGSSAEYAAHPEGKPIPEDHLLFASSIYGVSKHAMDEVARLYSFRYGLPIIRVRPFSIIGPRKEHDFCSDVAREIVLVERGEKENVRVGNLQVVRDFLDVRDCVKAMIMLSQKGTSGEVYNICSGKGYVLRSVLDRYQSLARVAVKERLDPKLLRNYDEMTKIGSPAKLFALGWNAQHNIQDTLADILDYWRSQR